VIGNCDSFSYTFAESEVLIILPQKATNKLCEYLDDVTSYHVIFQVLTAVKVAMFFLGFDAVYIRM
jgi:hypothetical protein